MLEIRKGHTSLGDQQSYYLQDFNNHRKKTKRAVFFSSRPFPNILMMNHGYDESFDEARFVMIFLIILEVTEIL